MDWQGILTSFVFGAIAIGLAIVIAPDEDLIKKLLKGRKK